LKPLHIILGDRKDAKAGAILHVDRRLRRVGWRAASACAGQVGEKIICSVKVRVSIDVDTNNFRSFTERPMRRSRGNPHCMSGRHLDQLQADAEPASAGKNKGDLIFCMKMRRQPHIKTAHGPHLHNACRRVPPVVPDMPGLTEALKKKLWRFRSSHASFFARCRPSYHHALLTDSLGNVACSGEVRTPGILDASSLMQG